ncbi:MAG: DUF4249 domain-containing protein [Bacteroidia bacterium]
MNIFIKYPIPAIFFLALLFLSGCRKEIDFRLFYEGDQLVINAMLTSNEPFFVELSHTISPSESIAADLLVANATVNLYQGDSLLFLLEEQAKGQYRAPMNWRPVPGESYKIEAIAAGYTTASTQPVMMPTPPDIQISSFQDSAYKPMDTGSSGGRVELTINDPASENDFYLIRAFADWDSIIVRISNILADPVLSGNSICSYNNSYLSDHCFVESPFKVIYLLSIPSNFDRSIRPSRILLQVSKISESYYRYYQYQIQPEDFELAFTDPAPTYTNVEQGYGFLGAQNIKMLEIPL